ncbi:hypothetical protein HYQ45_003065 [Verticillium longisporum]|uniref:FHA domain-containing protein n=1 Tax=Verticillium longisporum TaxID=100787 RepID=A0A8I2ZYJ6_VERLO|nr:hypothetical protein HYQ45_003065 [Verticillium longisporum]RBR00470.1 hypothetical protein VDGD_02614 [Verticillium dahliae]
MDTQMSTPIAWLLPANNNRWAAQATHMVGNSARRIHLDRALDDMVLVSEHQDSNMITVEEDDDDNSASDKENETVLTFKRPNAALALTFDHRPKGLHGFVIGTDPRTCDIVLPKLRGISRRHCHITFDAEKRLVVRDTSKHGTAVWYDGRSNGYRRRACWPLSSGFSYGFPAMVRTIVLDIQRVRFQVVVNECLPRMDAYEDLVAGFLSSVAVPAAAPAREPLRVENSLVPAPLRVQRPVFVKYTVESGDDRQPDTYLWNSARPWEPMVKVDA